MRYILLVIFICLGGLVCPVQQAFGNKEPDTLYVKKLNDSADFYAHSDVQRSITLAKKALGIAQKIKYAKGVVKAYMCLARTYYVTGEYDLSLSYGKKVGEVGKQINYTYALAFSVNNAGLIYLGQKKYKEALEEFKKALQINLKIKNLIGQSTNYFNIALCYIEFKNFEEAEKNLNKCLAIAETAYRRVYIMAINRLGDIAYERKHYGVAIGHYKKSLEKNDKGDDWEKAYSYGGMAKSLNAMGNYQQAIANAKTALALAEKLKAHWDMIRVLDVLHNASSRLGNYQDAYEYLKMHELYSDSLYNEEKDKEINLLHLQQKAAENKELANQIKIRQQKSKANQLTILAISVISLLLLAGVVIINRNHKKTKALNRQLLKNNDDIAAQKDQVVRQNQELEQLNHSKDQLFWVIGHDLRSPIFSIIQTIDLLRSDNLSAQERTYILNNFFEKLTATATMLDNLLMWANNQKTETTVERKNFLLPRLTEQLLLVLNFMANEKNVHIKHDFLHEAWVNADMNHARIIIQNLVSNAIKFTPSGGQIHIHYFVKADKVGIIIKDTGIGIAKDKLGKLFNIIGKDISTYGTANEKGIGIGLMLVKKYADDNNAQITVNSDESGTEFIVRFDMAN
jgi:signal transduction histidine kinase